MTFEVIKDECNHAWDNWIPCDECGETHIQVCKVCGIRQEVDD